MPQRQLCSTNVALSDSSVFLEARPSRHEFLTRLTVRCLIVRGRCVPDTLRAALSKAARWCASAARTHLPHPPSTAPPVGPSCRERSFSSIERRRPHSHLSFVRPSLWSRFRGSHSSNTSCLTQVFFNSCESCGKSWGSLTRQHTHRTSEAALDK